MKRFQYTHLTEKGKRNTNQDDVSIFFNKKKSAFLLVLADGMGGYKGGETASKIVIDSAEEVFKKMHKSFHDKKTLKLVIQLIFDTAQNRIKEYIEQYPEFSGMGTTMVCVLIVDNVAVWGNIGDSRIYLRIKNHLEQVTKDHSLVQDYIDKHNGTIPASYLNQYSNVITKSLAGNNDTIDLFPINKDYEELNDDFTFLLCSDGLILDKSYDYSYFFFETIKNAPSLEAASQQLYLWAFEGGSTDNISIAAISKEKKTTNSTSIKKALLILIPILFIMIASSAGYYYLHKPIIDTLIPDKSYANSKQFVNNKTESIAYMWKGFANVDSIIYSSITPNISLSWHEYTKGEEPYYIIKILYKDEVEIERSTTNEHMTNEQLNNNELNKLKKGYYTVKLFAITSQKDTIKAPNSIQLYIK